MCDSEAAWTDAIERDDVETVRGLCSDASSVNRRRAMNHAWLASAYGNLDIIAIIHEKSPVLFDDEYIQAVRYGHLHVLKYLNETRVGYLKRKRGVSARYARAFEANHPHLDAMRSMNGGQNGVVHFHRTLTRIASARGFLDILKYLERYECARDELAVRMAIQYDRRACARFLVETGCPYRTSDIPTEIESELWFQKHRYRTTGVVDRRTMLHYHHKATRIQRAWLRYAYHPRTRAGVERMRRTITVRCGLMRH